MLKIEQLIKKKEMEMNMNIPFPTDKEAAIVFDALRVEVEPARSRVTRKLETNGRILKVHFTAQEAKSLRVGVNSFLEHLILATQTIQQFGPPL